MFEEDKHPRDGDGKFVAKDVEKKGYDSRDDLRNIKKVAKKETSTKNFVKVDMNAKIQKQLDVAQSPQERQKIAYRYIMDNLRGKYTAPDGRTVAIEKIGADKITHRDIKVKLRVCPALAEMIKVGELKGVSAATDKPNPKFVNFAYYQVPFQVGEEKFIGLLNVGIRADNSSTLYDINPFEKQ